MGRVQVKNIVKSRGGSGETAYEKLYWRWVCQTFQSASGPRFAKSWQQLDSIKSFIHAMKANRCWDTWAAVTKATVSFLESSLDNDVFWSHAHYFLVKVLKLYGGGQLNNEMLKALVLEGLRFFLPSKAGAMDKDACASAGVSRNRTTPPWLFAKTSKDMVDVIFTPMHDAIIYEKKKKAEQASSSRPQAKKKQKHAPSGDVPEETMNVEEADGRSKVWLDDLLHAISSTYEHLPPATLQADVQRDAIAVAMSVSFEFAFAKQVKFGGRDFCKWSELRIEIRRFVHKQVVGHSLAATDGAAALESLVATLPDASAAQVDDDAVDRDMGVTAFGLELQRFLHGNDISRPIHMHDALKAIDSKLWDKASEIAEHSIMLTDLIKLIQSELSVHLQARWFEVCAEGVKAMGANSGVPSSMQEFFTTEAEFQAFRRLRTKYFAHAMMSVIEPNGLLKTTPVSNGVNHVAKWMLEDICCDLTDLTDV